MDISWTQDGSTGVLGPDLVADTTDVMELHDALLAAFADAGAVVCDLSRTAVQADPDDLAGALAGVVERVREWPAAVLTVVVPQHELRRRLLAQQRRPGLVLVGDVTEVRPPADTVLRACHSRLEPVLRAPALARTFLRTTLEDWPADGYRDDALVVVDELVANAVLHAGTEIELRLALQPDRLGVAVADRSPARPAVGRAGEAAESGRGMLLVDALARSWHVLPRRGGGKVVRAVLVADDAPDAAGVSLPSAQREPAPGARP